MFITTILNHREIKAKAKAFLPVHIPAAFVNN